MKQSTIAIIKVRGSQDVEFAPPLLIDVLSPLLALTPAGRRARETRGLTFMPNMVLPYLAALCRENDARCGTSRRYVLIDENEAAFQHWTWDVDLAMFTVSTTNAPASYRVADLARNRGVRVVMGGIHASTLPAEALGHADAVACGEAETIIGRIIEDFDRGTLSGQYEGGRSASLDNLPVPAWELGVTPLVKGPGRTRVMGSPRPYAPWVVPVQTSRGCRNACQFCSTTRYQGAERRHRPAADIVNEIRTLQARGIITGAQTVFFTDNNIVSDSDHNRGVRDTTYARTLFKALAGLGITWVGQGEVMVGEDPELVALMARSGCHTLLIGMETVKPHGLGRLGKATMEADRYASCLETLHDHGISNIGCFIMGLDGHGLDTFAPTAEFIRRYVDIPQISVLTPYPGTPLYYRMKNDDRILCHDWSLYDITHVVMRPDRMTALDLETSYSDLLRKVYSPANMLSRAFRYANRPTLGEHPLRSRVSRFTSVLAPNIVYRSLSLVGRGLPAQIYEGLGTARQAIERATVQERAFQAAS
jgi:radical SAM superfamily enzyme YgiQ (UPF0313 family)